jgi:hypothetical protein
MWRFFFYQDPGSHRHYGLDWLRYLALLRSQGLELVFIHCHAGCNLYFVADKAGIAACLPAGLDQPRPPIRDAISLYIGESMLHVFAIYCDVTKNIVAAL